MLYNCVYLVFNEWQKLNILFCLKPAVCPNSKIQLWNFVYHSFYVMIPKVHWYTYDWPPYETPYGVQVVLKRPKMTPTGLIFWNHIRWKSPKISCLLNFQIQKIGEIPQNWENLEIWLIFSLEIFKQDILISGTILSGNLVQSMFRCLVTSVTPYGSMGSLNTRNSC